MCRTPFYGQVKSMVLGEDSKKRLQQQVDFIVEIDKLKQILRRNYLVDGSRRENDAEHSWHLALMAVLLYEHAREEVDLLKVVKMVLIHDIVEIDAGDTYCYDDVPKEERLKLERKGAERIFGLLPPEQAREFKALWEEFEEGETPEARFAEALDRFQPMLHNYCSRGKSWQLNGVTVEMVVHRNRKIEDGAPLLWEYAVEMMYDAIEKGYLPEPSGSEKRRK